MKRKLTKIWGVGLIMVLMVSLLAIAAPVSAADPLQWNGETLPSSTNSIIIDNSQITDFAIASDGTTIYAVGTDGTNANQVYKSLDAGRTWVNLRGNQGLSNTTINTIGYVAIAPDATDTVVIADGTAANVTALVTTNGGTNWSDLGTVGANAIYDLAIAPQVPPGLRYVTVAGRDTAGAAEAPCIRYFDLGAASPSWKDAVDDATWTGLTVGDIDAFRALAFSPNFAADYTAVAISEAIGSSSENGSVQLHAISFNTKNWNAIWGGSAVTLESSATTNTLTVVKADISLAPDYVGSDDVSRVAFIGASILYNSAEIGGIYRCDDNQTPKELKVGTAMNSVAFNGTNLVAGALATNIVFRSADPLATTPTVIPSRSNKRIGVTDGTDTVIVRWNGEEVLAAKLGVTSAFSVSRDNGMTWNDLSLINFVMTDINDVYVTPDGSKLFVLVDNAGTETSLFRQVAGSWERVLTIGDGENYFLRGAPDNNDVLYIVDSGSTTIYYTSDAGENRWYERAAAAAVTDLAVESADICYIATAGAVRKSTNGGFTWGSPKTVELAGGSISNIQSLGTDKVLVSGNGRVSYSLDGNSSWVKVAKPFLGAGGAGQATATGLDAGDYIFAATTAANADVMRWTVGDTPAVDWKNLNDPAGRPAYGIAYVNGALYVSTSNSTGTEVLRCLNPTSGAAWEWSTLADTGALSTNTPQALKTSAGSTKLWYVNNASTEALRSYIDTLADTGPTLDTPADGFQNPLNTVTGRASEITFRWSRPSVNVVDYDIYIYSDAAGKNRVTRFAIEGERGPSVSYLVGPFAPSGQTFEWVAGQNYYWRARVSSRVGTGPVYSTWSEMRSITIEAGAASVPSIASPANGASGVSKSPAFSWSPVVNATKYEFQLGADTTFASPLVSAELAVTGIQPVVTLDASKTYFWRVRSLEPTMSSWSTISNFTVAAPPPPAPPPPVVVKEVPAPVINIPAPPPAQEIVIPPAPQPVQPISPGLLWAVIIIGAVLVIAVIVLIVRTRRTV